MTLRPFGDIYQRPLVGGARLSSLLLTPVAFLLLVGVPGSLSAALAAEKSQESCQATLKKVDVSDGVTIETVTRGTGEPVVLVSGQGMGSDSLAQLAVHLCHGGVQSIIVNPRGVEGSSGQLEGLTLHDFAADVAGVIKTLKHPRVHILGYAWGGRVVRLLAVDRPKLVKSVIVLAVGGKAGPTPEAVATMQKMKPGLSTEEKREAVRILFFAPSSDPAPFMDLKLWDQTAGSQMKAMLATPVDEWWSGGDAPMLVIQGLNDQLAPPANGRALRDDYSPRVKLVELPNAGHALVLERPGKISEVVRDYIKNHSDKGVATSAQTSTGAKPRQRPKE